MVTTSNWMTIGEVIDKLAAWRDLPFALIAGVFILATLLAYVYYDVVIAPAGRRKLGSP